MLIRFSDSNDVIKFLGFKAVTNVQTFVKVVRTPNGASCKETGTAAKEGEGEFIPLAVGDTRLREKTRLEL